MNNLIKLKKKLFKIKKNKKTLITLQAFKYISYRDSIIKNHVIYLFIKDNIYLFNQKIFNIFIKKRKYIQKFIKL